MFKNALVSVSDKSGLIEFLQPLVAKGMRVVSTGGTARHLKEAGIQVVDVSEQTGSPEVMDGRVKTLHPKVHMALLARAHVASDMELLKEQALEPFDLVLCNLYPFEEALKKDLSDEEQIEFIDIGGPSMLRSAAKSFNRIAVICDPSDYQWVADKSELTLKDRRFLAAKVFSHTATYDSMIAQYMGADQTFPQFALGGSYVSPLRYGENPQQSAGWYSLSGAKSGLHQAEILQGKPLSYNNILDLDAACETLREFTDPTSVAVKHNNPCGVAVGRNLFEAVVGSLKADPVSVFGGIIALNGKVDGDTAAKLSEIFLECIVAADYAPEALQVFAKKKNLRILKWPQIANQSLELKVKTIGGGFLVQTQDQVKGWSNEWSVLGNEPPPEIKVDLGLAWKVCAHLKSNAIALVSGSTTVGLGMGQVNRVDAVEQAIARMRKFHGDATNVVLASDAFFPFADSIELAAKAGVKWVIQPGGSIKDEEVKSKAKELGVTMVLTGTRHFQH
ncbi:MAG: bifunctional phosphoribosylaminoimidazolecarboxamide formyltransferase/IMP cyclohydrolase [Bdellovibrionaceae bacterium]|nr:bifunctional phosphoribosylaminoimidazolecarboxamide formyltransferase/IMP cyclohydrolase [Bdellovibrionales bacterium]MCB9084742.1 bifunctional phosphoribosylaminoimidazolecarboxamide formyltransferase/IMP cyclohydrolase [Pseudobdellovibrionaceae bacterium]